MTQIIPAILVSDRAEFLEKIRRVKNLVTWIHLDVMDGTLTPRSSFSKPDVICKFPQYSFEIHLMTDRSSSFIYEWIHAGAKRIIFHIEGKDDSLNVIRAIKNEGAEAYIALNPETPIEKIRHFLKAADGITVLGVTPGAQGQKFQTSVLKKIHDLRLEFPELPIEADGGVNPETAPLLVKSGASRLVSGSYFFQNPSFKEALEHLQNSLS